MSVRLSDFATGATLADTDHVVGYSNTSTGGERKWTVANLRNSLITGAATTIDTEDLTADRVLISTANGKVGVSTVTSSGLGTVTSVTGTAPISVANGTTTPAISIATVTQLAAGIMSTADKIKLDGLTQGIAESNFTGGNQSLATNGYQKFPGGLIIQWATTGNVAGDSNLTVNFPIAFPTACLCAVATVDTSGDTWTTINSFSRTQISVSRGFQTGGVNGSGPIYYFAIGY